MLSKFDKLLEAARASHTETAVLLGSGSSIERITPAEWLYIMGHDTWTTNNWIYHPFFVPKYYMVETKYYGYDILRRRFLEKWEHYRDVQFIFAYGKRIRMKDGRRLYLRDVVPESAYRYEFTCTARDPRRTHDPFNADYEPLPHCLTKSYDMSMTLVFEILHKVGYKRVIIFGIDLGNSRYFWSSGDRKYGEVHHLYNKAHEHKNPGKPHATFKIKDFIIDVQNRWFAGNDKSLFVGHRDTALYPHIPYKDVARESMD